MQLQNPFDFLHKPRLPRGSAFHGGVTAEPGVNLLFTTAEKNTLAAKEN
jgi:hypothetical protein